MKLVCLMLAASVLRFEVTDARGRKPGGVTVEAADPDGDGWYRITLAAKGKGEPVLIWPFDGRAKQQDGPEGIPVLVVEKGDPRAAASVRVAAALAAGKLLGFEHDVGVDMEKAISALPQVDDAFAKGVGLMAAGKPADAVEPLGRALKERERQLTRVPSEIYPAAMLYGKALLAAGKFDDAAVAYLKALKQRPSDAPARKGRNEALIRAGKPDAATEPDRMFALEQNSPVI
jgi:tetratricopeptide (TPR) repeat protein